MVKVNSSIFHQYDVRGIYPEELNVGNVRNVANAIGQFLGARLTGSGQARVIVGEDARNSSPELRRAVIEGLNDAGVNVVHIGLPTTPLFYFAVNNLKTDGGIMITASHNPPQYNGLKIMNKKGMAVDLNSGL